MSRLGARYAKQAEDSIAVPSAEPPTAPPAAAPVASPPVEATEAYGVLRSLAQKKTLGIPESLLASHVLEITRNAAWPVQRAAIEALLRRCASATDCGHHRGINRHTRTLPPAIDAYRTVARRP